MSPRKKTTSRGTRRAPMGAKTADVNRAERGRTPSATTPVCFRGAIEGDGSVDRDFIRKWLGQKLGKYASRIDRLDVALATNAPARGGVGKRITIEASVARDGSVTATASGANTRAAFMSANAAIERSIRRSIERSRSARRSAER